MMDTAMQQADLFQHDADLIPITEIIDRLSVSAASVQNWIKTGYLESVKKGYVDKSSFDRFEKEIIGKIKLTKRANKLSLNFKDESIFKGFSIQGMLDKKYSLIEISDIYQNSLGNSYRNKEGIYYTPSAICQEIFIDIPSPKSDQLFCDPCCGSGNFIIAAIDKGFLPENIYGYDCDPIAVELTRRRIFEKTGYHSNNIYCADFLDTFYRDNISFDVILSNPPWGKKCSREDKIKYSRIFNIKGHFDMCELFLLASLRQLKENGFLAFLMPESFFKVAAFQKTREVILQKNILSFRDFSKPFKGLMTKAQSFCLKKENISNCSILCVGQNEKFKRSTGSFLYNPSIIINFTTSPQDVSVLDRVYSVKYITLRNNAEWALGIVTGNNDKFCKKRNAEGLVPVYKGGDIHKTYLDKPSNFIERNFSIYQQVAPLNFFEAEEKLFYRFISDKLVFYHDKNKAYCLNSVNILIPHKSFPIAQEQLAALLNTELFSWIFQKIFSTHKILRRDLEELPLPIEFIQKNKVFSERQLMDFYHIERNKNGTFRVEG